MQLLAEATPLRPWSHGLIRTLLRFIQRTPQSDAQFGKEVGDGLNSIRPAHAGNTSVLLVPVPTTCHKDESHFQQINAPRRCQHKSAWRQQRY